MRKLFIVTAIVGLIGAGAYAPAASANSVSLQLIPSSNNPNFLGFGQTVSWNVVMVLDGTGGGDGNLSNTVVTIVMSNPVAARITHGVSAPTSSGVGLTNFNLRDAAFVAVGSCINTATTGTCTFAPGAEAAGNYGGLATLRANIGTFTVGTVTVRAGFAAGATTAVQLIIRPGTEWTDGFGNAVTPPFLGSAFVQLVPEPATASLLGLGLIGLIAVGRRSRP